MFLLDLSKQNFFFSFLFLYITKVLHGEKMWYTSELDNYRRCDSKQRCSRPGWSTPAASVTLFECQTQLLYIYFLWTVWGCLWLNNDLNRAISTGFPATERPSLQQRTHLSLFSPVSGRRLRNLEQVINWRAELCFSTACCVNIILSHML